MRNYVIINGVNSNTIQGLAINLLPPITKPMMRTQIEEIDGRDGDIITELGYSAYDKEMEIGLWGTYDINQVISFFNGEGTITFSNESDKQYYFKIINQIDYEKLAKFKVATVTFHCQPFKYPLEETPVEITIQNVTGSGETIDLDNTAEAPVTLALKGNTSQKTTTGKNLFNIEGQYETGTGITLTKNNDGSYTLNGTANGNNFFRGISYLNKQHTISYSSNTSNGNVIIRTRTGTPTAQTGIQDQLLVSSTSGSLTSSKQFDFVEISIVSGTTLNNFKIYIQLEKGSSATSWEKYTGGKPAPSPDYPQEIEVVTGRQEIDIVGKNLLKLKDGSNVSQGVTITINNNKMSFIGTPTRAYVGSAEMPLYLKKGTYTFSSTNGVNSFFLWFKNQSGSVFSSVAIRPDPSTITINEDATAIQIGLEGLTIGTACNVESYFQLEKGSTATTYEPYQSQSYEINLGKNLFDKSKANLNKGVATGSGALYNSDINFSTDYIEVNSNGTYYTASGVSSVANRVYGAQYDSNKQYVGAISTNAGTRTFYISNTSVKYIRLTGLLEEIDTYQVERGSETTSYAPYKEPIEVNYIPNTECQDYFYKDSNKWYLHKEIGKVDLSTLTWNDYPVSTGYRRYTTGGVPNVKYVSSNQELGKALAEKYTNHTGSGMSSAPNRFCIDVSLVQAVDTTTPSGYLYYELATPEDEEITDNTLIGQLNALENVRSYDTTTHINQNTANKPFIINATAVQKGTDTGTVDNIGNIYAKPTIDIEGSGTVGIYLDGNQMFSVDLSNANECIIDTASLEAYNPSTSALMNRQVTGDYSNFKLNAGENTVKVSGNVTKATISNYTRWL